MFSQKAPNRIGRFLVYPLPVMSSTTVQNPANGSFPSRSCRLRTGCVSRYEKVGLSNMTQTICSKVIDSEGNVQTATALTYVHDICILQFQQLFITYGRKCPMTTVSRASTNSSWHRLCFNSAWEEIVCSTRSSIIPFTT